MIEYDEVRIEIAKAVAAGRKETELLKAQGLPDAAIMRIWEKRTGLKWNEETQTYEPDHQP